MCRCDWGARQWLFVLSFCQVGYRAACRLSCVSRSTRPTGDAHLPPLILIARPQNLGQCESVGHVRGAYS